MNNITIELCAEDRTRLDKLINALEKSTQHNCKACAETEANIFKNAHGKEVPTDELVKDEPTQVEEPVKEEPTAVETPTAPTEEEPAKEPEPVKEEAPAVTRAMVQQKVVSLAAIPAKKSAVRDIVNSYAAKVSDIPEDKLAEAFERLTALED